MSTRQQTVRTYEPTKVERFDDQFWPVLMALSITATILAATIVTLMAGFWMWVSLMILPAAVMLLLVTLRFVDSKRLRRSLQLAVILSLAAHCLFLIFAKQTSIFNGFFMEIAKNTTPVQQQRVIHISSQTQMTPWMEENPVPTPDVTEPTPEKQATVETSTTRPQPTQNSSQDPTENPQLVRREQLSRTVPRLGKNPSQLSRQSENAQPKSSEQVELAQPAPANPSARSSELEPSSTALTRRSNSSSATAAKSRRESTSSRQPSESSTARNENSRQPVRETSEPRSSRRATSSTRPDAANPSQVVQAPTAARQPESPRAASLPSDTANLKRRTRNSETPTNAKLERNRATASRTNQVSQPQPERRSETSTVTNRQPSNRPSRSANSAATPATPEVVERPRPANPSTVQSGMADLNPQPMALERSTNGTSGVGRTVNFDRATGARQSSAMTPSESLRRREETTRQRNPNSLALKEMARVPRSAAAEPVPSVVHRPDSIPVATRAAAEAPAELTAGASASLTQSNADARRSETSVSKGSGNVDLGPRKIVSESVERRTEGGGQPEVQQRPVSQQLARRGDSGSSAPSMAAETIENVAVDNGQSSSDNVASDLPVPSATADRLTRRDGQTADSGAPVRSDDNHSDRMNTTPVDLADASLGRASHDSDSDDDDEEEERRRRERAMDLARSARQMAGSDTPGSSEEIENVAQTSSGTQGSPGTESTISDAVASDLSGRSSARNGESGISRNSDTRGETGSGATSSEALSQRAENSTATPGASQERMAQNQRSTTGESGSGLEADGEMPQVTGQSQIGQGLANQITDADRMAQIDRQSPAGMALKIDADPGPAGIGSRVQEDAGIDSRRASRDSPAIQSVAETRFRKKDVGGAPAVNSSPVIASEAYRTRGQTSRSSSAPRTEEAIELGLAFLARQQQEDGSWTLHGIPEDKSDNVRRVTSDTAATGLAVLAFQGAGYNHKEFKYAGQLQSAVNWLINNQQPTGELYIKSDEYSDSVCRLYSHGIATLALAEAYGMTQDEDIRIAVQLALDYIADSQHERLGGWRYRVGSESDTSVTGWMMMAMQSGRLAGLETDQKTWMGIQRWLRLARDPSREHLFRYNPEARDRPETRHGRQSSPCMTSVGLLMHVYLGWDRQDPRLSEGADYIMQNMPDDSTINRRDTYYWYYATQIIRHVGGDSWEQWHGALHPLLVGSQIKESGIATPWSSTFTESNNLAGSWDPLNPVPDRWGAQAGRLYVTAMNLLSLEVDYRLLPLHDDTLK